MRLTDLFVKRPVLAIVVNLVILIAGLQSIRALSVRQYPRSDIAVVRVSTVYVGANADLVRGFITTPLERVIASADCGFGTFTGREWVIEPAVWLKLKSLREGADLASARLWG